MSLLLLYSPQTQTWNLMCFHFFKISSLISSKKNKKPQHLRFLSVMSNRWSTGLPHWHNSLMTAQPRWVSYQWITPAPSPHSGIQNVSCAQWRHSGEMPATQKLTDISRGSALTYRTPNLALSCKNHVPKKRRLRLCGWWPLREWTRGALPFWHAAHILEIRERKQLWELLNDLKMCGKEFGNRLNPGQRVAVMSPSLIFIFLPTFSTSLPDFTILRVRLTFIAQLFGLLKCCICHCGLFL